MNRSARVERTTKETSITVDLNLDGTGVAEVSTGIPFYDHMLDQLGRHGGFDLRIAATGDLHIDTHHTVEDLYIGNFFVWSVESTHDECCDAGVESVNSM